jgi:hypothetical protein
MQALMWLGTPTPGASHFHYDTYRSEEAYDQS